VMCVCVLNIVFCGLSPSCNFLKEALRFGNGHSFRPSTKKHLGWWTP
jgi:hypothetical protein